MEIWLYKAFYWTKHSYFSFSEQLWTKGILKKISSFDFIKSNVFVKTSLSLLDKGYVFGWQITPIFDFGEFEGFLRTPFTFEWHLLPKESSNSVDTPSNSRFSFVKSCIGDFSTSLFVVPWIELKETVE